MGDEYLAAVARLKEGNQRFREGTARSGVTSEQLSAALEGQRPWAAVLGCSDSRVPVETVFDVGIGDLFVVRNAGDVASPEAVASLRFAAEVLGASLVVVLGHQECGAVNAALAGNQPDWLDPVVDGIHLQTVPDTAEQRATAGGLEAVRHHVTSTAAELRSRFSREALHQPPHVAAALYHLATGEVEWIEE